jgi:hypothetical protein
MAGQPAASFKFNSFAEIKSHSSILYNERVAILFYLLDMKSMKMNTSYSVTDTLEVRSTLLQIYKNIRMLLRNNPVVRATLNLETKEQGIYVTDVALGMIDQMIRYCEMNGYTTKRLFILAQELNKFEMMIKDVLQYFHYFIRPDFRQKPDVEIATEKYKEMADKRTIQELRDIVGKSHGIDFESLGSSRIDLKQEIDYNPIVDGEMSNEELEDYEDEKKEFDKKTLDINEEEEDEQYGKDTIGEEK